MQRCDPPTYRRLAQEAYADSTNLHHLSAPDGRWADDRLARDVRSVGAAEVFDQPPAVVGKYCRVHCRNGWIVCHDVAFSSTP